MLHEAIVLRELLMTFSRILRGNLVIRRSLSAKVNQFVQGRTREAENLIQGIKYANDSGNRSKKREQRFGESFQKKRRENNNTGNCFQKKGDQLIQGINQRKLHTERGRFRKERKITGNDSGNHSKRTEDNDSGNRSRKRSQRFRESFPEEDTNDSGFSFQEKGRPEFALIACRRKKKEAEAFYLGIEKRKQFYHSGTKGYPGFILPILFY
ncbi:hypothetical protein Tco_0478836 [Tanacetum coccineum]